MKRLTSILFVLMLFVFAFYSSPVEAACRCQGHFKLSNAVKKIQTLECRLSGRRCCTTVGNLTCRTPFAEPAAPKAEPAPKAAPAPKIDPKGVPAPPAAAPTKAEVAAIQATKTETIVYEMVNAERVKRGLKPLSFCGNLLTSARTHCLWMASTHRMQHTSKPVGENIAMGQNTCTSVMNTWMNSSGHRANILGGWNRVGVAAYTATSGRIYWCLQFLR